MSGHLTGPISLDDRAVNGSGKLPRFRTVAEPLSRFTDAKKRISDIFDDLEGYVVSLQETLFYLSSNHKFVSSAQSDEVDRFRDSILTIKEMFGRDHMKVVFFGRTSNGKSTVINAMLHAKVLPQGIGHTTSCFLQVEASPDEEQFVLTEGSKERFAIQNLDKLAHALRSEDKQSGQMGHDGLVRILYPKNASKLLQNEVFLLDSPGIDLSPQFDCWIDRHCLDADVFVLVCNAEATLTQSEKSFFHRVGSKLSRPNIFILNNRWDASAAEPDQMEQVREQHMGQFRRFLVDELHVCSSEEAINRIFFVSAKEVLNERLKFKGETPGTPATSQIEGHLLRGLEFNSFEKQFETCISKSAIRTKFEAHVRRGRDITTDLHRLVEQVHSSADTERDSKSTQHQHKVSELRQSQASFQNFIQKCQEECDRLRTEVHLKVSADFHDEIRRLPTILDRFDHKFVDQPSYLDRYRSSLTEFVDETVTSDLEIRCTGGLLERIIAVERDFVGIAGVSSFLPDLHSNKAAQVVQFRQPFRFSIAVDCRNLVADFREDLQFRFSLSLGSLVRRFVTYRSARSMTILGNNGRGESVLFGGSTAMFPSRLCSESSDSAPFPTTSEISTSIDSHEAFVSTLVLSTASYVANGSVGLLILAGLIYRAVGWRLIALGAGTYLGLYSWERLRWNGHAKERHFKEQYTRHLADRLKQLATAHTAQCENQVVRELDEVQQGLKAAVAQVHVIIRADIDSLCKEIEQLTTIAKDLAATKGKAKFLVISFDSFEADFFKENL